MARLDDIVGYTYKADIYCPEHIIDQLPMGEGEAFDGWALVEPARMSTEDNLTELAAAFGIDRFDEWTYDSDDFPKVVFRDSLEEYELCGYCAEPLDG